MLQTHGTKFSEIFDLIANIGRACVLDFDPPSHEWLEETRKRVIELLRKIDRVINELGQSEFQSTKTYVVRWLQETRTRTWQSRLDPFD